MIRNAARAIRATVALAVLTGLLYPLVMTGVAQVVFRGKADGSLIHADGRTVGSSLIGQAWTGPQWFYGRPSATSTPYDASASSGSNLGPLSRPLAEDVRARIDAILKIEGPYHQGLVASEIPVDLVTSSASGLDPDISPGAARFQAPRIAAVHGISLATVVKLIDQHTEGRTLGVLGEPRINVLQLNLALERLGQG